MKISTLQQKFNKHIRDRDKDLGCISCGIKVSNPHAGHYLPVRWYGYLRFNKHNVNAQCQKCNIKNNFVGYRNGLILKIGIKALLNLEQQALDGKPKNFTWSDKRKQKVLHDIKRNKVK